MSKKTTMQMTVGDESARGCCCAPVAELPRGRCKPPACAAGKMVIANMPENGATVQVDNRDPCRERMVLTMEDMSISMEQSACSRATGTRGANVTTLCVQAKGRNCCPHHCRPGKTILETQFIVRK